VLPIEIMPEVEKKKTITTRYEKGNPENAFHSCSAIVT
jgi:hypothetical protein